jgi:hypothetical protein
MPYRYNTCFVLFWAIYLSTGFRIWIIPLGKRGSVRGRNNNFSLLHSIKTGSNFPLLLSGYLGSFPLGQSGLGVKLANLLHLIPRLRMSGAVPPLHHISYLLEA